MLWPKKNFLADLLPPLTTDARSLVRRPRTSLSHLNLFASSAPAKRTRYSRKYFAFCKSSRIQHNYGVGIGSASPSNLRRDDDDDERDGATAEAPLFLKSARENGEREFVVVDDLKESEARANANARRRRAQLAQSTNLSLSLLGFYGVLLIVFSVFVRSIFLAVRWGRRISAN